MAEIFYGTCSWKYESWRGIVYPEFGEFNFLEEYSKKYKSVEIDQWFWSLHPNNKITLPKPNVVKEYNKVTPDDFKFTIKVPNSITLTHPYKSELKNSHFMSVDLMETFLSSIEPLGNKVSMLIFQFEYLNKQKMKSLGEFLFHLEKFFSQLDRNYNFAIEIRNPNYLKDEFFAFLKNHGLSFTFLHGYYMPPIFNTFEKFESFLTNKTVLRLHGFDRKGIEKQTNNIWNKIVSPQDEDISRIVTMVRKLKKNEVDVFLNVNNHFEGSAPLTINKLLNALEE